MMMVYFWDFSEWNGHENISRRVQFHACFKRVIMFFCSSYFQSNIIILSIMHRVIGGGTAIGRLRAITEVISVSLTT
jgi:hypothetical protein